MSHRYVAPFALESETPDIIELAKMLVPRPFDRTLFHNRTRLSNKESIKIVCQLGNVRSPNERKICLRGGLIFFEQGSNIAYNNEAVFKEAFFDFTRNYISGL